MKKSVSSRIKITKTGKIRRRVMQLSHARANKSSVQLLRKKRARSLNVPKRIIKKYL